MAKASPQDLQKWIGRISNNEMPIFGRTVQKIMSVSQDEVSSAIQLGQVVLKDAVMTSRILKLANSAFYNTSGQKFSTISRAIMMLGFNTVKNMCLTVTLIDSLAQGIHRDYLVKEMARSLHAATQAQIIAEERGEEAPEEIFIATLLYNIGDLAFWCFSDEVGEELHKELSKEGVSEAEAQQKVLGFTLHDLSQGLAQEWSLSDLLKQTLSHPKTADPQYQTIALSHKLAKNVELGWKTPDTLTTAKSISKLIKKSPKDTISQLHEVAKSAASTSRIYGAHTLAKAIPLPNDGALETTVEAVLETADDDQQIDNQFPAADPKLQLQMLRELMSLGSEKANFTILVEMALEGIHRGVGMHHALFAILTPNRQGIKAKQVLGDQDDQLKNRFSFIFNEKPGRLWHKIIEKRNGCWINDKMLQELHQEIPSSLEGALKTREFFAAPVFINNKAIGLFYADRSASDEPLDQESYDSFTLFTQQAIMLLNNLLGGR